MLCGEFKNFVHYTFFRIIHKFSRVFFLLFFLNPFLLRAENLQLVMPKIVYVGDTVEIRYIFHSDLNIFGDYFENPSAKLNIQTDHSIFLAREDSFTVQSASLEKINSEYTFSLSLIPWKTGLCTISQFNLSSLIESPENRPSAPFVISLSPIEVKSLAQKTENHDFLPQASPLTLPGTTAFLAILAIFAFVLFAALLFALLHLPQIARCIEHLSYMYSLRKNSRQTIKNLLALQKNSSSFDLDKDFAAEIQHILREFLNKRFGHDFSSVATAKLYPIFTEISGGNLTDQQETAVESLLSIFARLDFVRFSENAQFLTEAENNGTHERFTITQNAIQMVEQFDKEEE